MRKNIINIKREFHRQVLKDYFIIEAFSNYDDSNYLINKIIEGTQEENNRSFVTNVFGKMTNWKYFTKDKTFLKNVIPIISHLEKQISMPPFILHEAWGLMEGQYDYTKLHDHAANIFSGVFYLNNHHQELIFPEVDIKIKPEKNKIVLFNGFLKHKADRNFEENIKYAIAFNCIGQALD